MLNIFAKSLLVSTSLSPVLGAVAINQLECGEPWTVWIWWLIAAVLLIILCWVLLTYAAKNIQKGLFTVRNFERKDQETLTFLFIYLLPFLRSNSSVLDDGWFASLYVLGIIVLAIVYSAAFHFNPVMRFLFGYRFYSAKDPHGVSNLLISRTDLRRPGAEIQTVRLASNVHLHIGGEDA